MTRPTSKARYSLTTVSTEFWIRPAMSATLT